MTVRWPIVGSLAALVAGAGLAALVLALCAESGNEQSIALRPTRTPFSRSTAATGSPTSGSPSPVAPTLPPEDTPEVPAPPPPEETPPPADTAPGEPTVAPADTPLAPSPTQGPETPTSVPATATRVAFTPTPSQGLPDLVVLDMFVSNDRLGLHLGNTGEEELPAGQEVEFLLRGVATETVTLGQALLPGASVRVVFEDQVIYRPELVLAVADPNNAIPEEDEGNNSLANQLEPDVALDLAVHSVFRAVDAPRLRVVIRNPTQAPAIQVTGTVTVFLGDVAEPAAEPTYQLNIEPLGFETVEVRGVAAMPGTRVRVVVEMTDPPDADPSNNVWEGIIS